MMLRSSQEGAELIGAPDSPRFNVAITRVLSAVGWIGCKQSA